MSSGGSNTPFVAVIASTTSTVKRNSDDVAWQWGECRKPESKNWITCLLCQKSMSGGRGISHLKENITNTKGNVTSCLNATIEIQKKINNQLAIARNKKVEKERAKYIIQMQDVEGAKAEELEMLEVEGGTRMLSQRAANIGAGARKIKGVDDVRGPMDQLLNFDAKKQATLDKNNPHKQVLKKRAWNCITKWAYEVGLPLNVVCPDSFTEMFHVVGDYGEGLPPPSYHNMQVTLLRDVCNEIKLFVDAFKKRWEVWMFHRV